VRFPPSLVVVVPSARATFSRHPSSLLHDGSISTPVHLVQTGKIIVEERRRKKFPCGTRRRSRRSALHFSGRRVSYCAIFLLLFVPPVRPGEFIGYIAAKSPVYSHTPSFVFCEFLWRSVVRETSAIRPRCIRLKFALNSAEQIMKIVSDGSQRA